MTRIVLLSSPEMCEISDNIVAHLAEKGLGVEQQTIEYITFPDGSIKPVIPGSVRRKEVVFLHSLYYPDPNTALMKLFLVSDALKRADVERVTVVIPYIPYLRQDRKDGGRVPIAARMIADIIETNPKITRVITMDMHADQIQGFFSIPVDNLYGHTEQAKVINSTMPDVLERMVVASTDFGGAVRVRRLAKKLGNLPVSLTEKKRTGTNTEILNVIGAAVEGQTVVLYDDMIDTATSIISAGGMLMDMGAAEVIMDATHGILSPKDGTTAEYKLAEAGFRVIVTNTIPRTPEYLQANPWLTIHRLDPLLGDVLYEALIDSGSVSKLFQ